MKKPEYLQDDGLATPEVGDWSEEKYSYLQGYADIFTKAMTGKWHLVYLDLFAGAGRAKIKSNNRVVAASPLLALGLHRPFDRYVFSEQDEEKLNALRQRVEREHPVRDVRYVHGDVNKKVTEILGEFPPPSQGQGVLTFCFADPYACPNLHFATIHQLAKRKVDFLVLIPSGYANRNLANYLDPKSKTLEEFLGDPEWRKAWQAEGGRYPHFADFVTDRFGQSMKSAGYIYEGLHDSLLVRSTAKNLPLYDLVLFSRHSLGEKFGREIRKYNRSQLPLFS